MFIDLEMIIDIALQLSGFEIDRIHLTSKCCKIKGDTSKEGSKLKSPSRSGWVKEAPSIADNPNKGESRRKDFGLLLENHPEIQVFLTADDPNYEDPLAIAEEISSFITRPVEKIADREEAIQLAMATTSKPEDAVIIAGKGADCYQIVNGVKEEYPGDAAIAKHYL